MARGALSGGTTVGAGGGHTPDMGGAPAQSLMETLAPAIGAQQTMPMPNMGMPGKKTLGGGPAGMFPGALGRM